MDAHASYAPAGTGSACYIYAAFLRLRKDNI